SRTMDFSTVPLTPEQVASTSPIDVDLTRRPTWRIPDSVLSLGQSGMDLRPDGRGWAITRVVSDSGVLDVFDTRVDGTLRRLTFGRKDDLEPSWAPDGSAFVFVTATGTRYGRYDLAVYDTLTR